MRPPLASETSEGAQGFFSKITFLKSVHSKERDEACLGFLVKIFTKSLHRRGVKKHPGEVHNLFILLQKSLNLSNQLEISPVLLEVHNHF